MEFLTSVRSIGQFEKQNADVAVNFFGYEIEGKDEYVYPLRISILQRARVVNLMLISNVEKNHHCWIMDMS